MDKPHVHKPSNIRLDYTVNYHLLWQCNFGCRYCYATFDDQRESFRKGMLSKDVMLRLVDLLSACFRKITFAGGEPTLCPWIGDLIRLAKYNGCLTNLVSNGSRLDRDFLEEHSGQLDFLTLSIDSADPSRQEMIGRVSKSTGKALATRHYLEISKAAKDLGIGVKVNTVVCQSNWDDDLSDLINEISPLRWKLLQAMPVAGQNDEHIADLTPATWQFDSFISKHDPSLFPGVRIVPEPITTIRGSYVMVDPQGRFFDSTKGKHIYSQAILHAGIPCALSQVNFDPEKFALRNGSADWETSPDILSNASALMPA